MHEILQKMITDPDVDSIKLTATRMTSMAIREHYRSTETLLDFLGEVLRIFDSASLNFNQPETRNDDQME